MNNSIIVSLHLYFIHPGGSLTRQAEQDLPVESLHSHIANIGTMVETTENKMRNDFNEIYFDKTRNILNGLRSHVNLSEKKSSDELKKDLASALASRAAEK